MITRLIFLSLIAFPLLFQGQEVRLCHSQVPGPNQTDSLKIYLKSLSSDSVALRGVNLSVAYHDSCAQYLELFGPFSDTWGAFFEDTLISTNLSLNYAGQTFDSRLQYGNSDPSPLTPKILYAPPNQDSAILAITFIFQGSCAANVYLEDEGDNPVNQIGDENHTRMDYLLESCVPMSTSISSELETLPIKLWPIPTREQLHFEPGSIGKQPYEMRIITLEGKVMHQQSLPAQSGQEEVSLDVQHLSAGFYLLELRGKTTKALQKFIISR